MSKLTGDDIIKLIKESREKDYSHQENWENIEDMGLSDYYKRILGEMEVVDKQEEDMYYSYTPIVWHFKDHDVYIKSEVSEGSYGSGYRLNAYDLKQVFPKRVEITIYE